MSPNDARLSGLQALAAEMASEDLERDGPVRAVFTLVGDRWTMLILSILGLGAWRHAELRRTVATLAAEGCISQRILTQKLRALEQNGFVERRVSTHTPPRVAYSLTPLGQGLLAQGSALVAWIKTQEAEIETARSHYDADLI